MKTSIIPLAALLLLLCSLPHPLSAAPPFHNATIFAFSMGKLWPLIPLLMVGLIILMSRTSKEQESE